MARYAMVIVNNLCTGCQTCSVACKMENLTLPGCARTRITERADTAWDVAVCMQCDDPPCVGACPVKATSKNDKGIIVVEQDACIGCGKCIEACPYDARRLNPEKLYFSEPLPFEEMAKKAGEANRRHVAGKGGQVRLVPSPHHPEHAAHVRGGVHDGRQGIRRQRRPGLTGRPADKGRRKAGQA